MITNLPDSTLFKSSSIKALHLATTIVMDLLGSVHRRVQPSMDDEERLEYYKKGQDFLQNAVVLIGQSHELYLKSMVCAISPYLLLRADVDKWPSTDSTGKVDFSKFYMPDASQLPKIIRVAGSPISAKSELLINDIRTKRNRSVHHGDIPFISPKELISIIVKTHIFYGVSIYYSSRREYLGTLPDTLIGVPDSDIHRLLYEFDLFKESTTSEEFKSVTGYPRADRGYKCYECSIRGDVPYGFPVTCRETKLSSGTLVIDCLVCGENYQVKKRNCSHRGCRSKLIEDAPGNRCFKCLQTNP